MEAVINTLKLSPAQQLSGEVTLPGSKSISNRALLLAALAHGETEINNLLVSDDTQFMLNALAQLGVQISSSGTQALVTGKAGPLVTDDRKVDLYLGLAGTAIRPLAAALTLGNGEFTLTGEPRMTERPIEHLVTTLNGLGANIVYTAKAGFPPIHIKAAGLNGGQAEIPGHISSQFLTSALLSAPLAKHPVVLDLSTDLASKPYLDITLHLMRQFGAQVANRDDAYRSFAVDPGQYQSPGSFLVEGDASSASYFLAAGAIRGAGMTVHGIGTDSVQGDVGFVDVLQAMGAKVTRHATSIEVQPGKLRGVDMDLNHIPDAAMTLGVLALFAKGTTVIRNIYNWRVKETDRLIAMATELRKLGAQVEEGEDYLSVTPPTTLTPATIDTYGDHRIAMCFSLAALGGAAITINNPQCVNKTFPEYFNEFQRLTS